ncbi:pitrilysin family protein [Reyranella sp. CPCC 100927]|uniref:M16 family metallopeptidase n=1 Tax=Reyranella sp. CPCC 100927 TaxID=2599616 RepID=UPI0011B4DF9B|nr:pitrilysin family protein [Reyranella sp. CPCC 100927]TWT05131.1 insulinase family protein [Reyranella sp. CPCC 100927]
MLTRRDVLAAGSVASLFGLMAPLSARAQTKVSMPALPPVPSTTTFELANGLQVIVLPSARAPIVNQMIWYKVGSADEPAGKSGIAHFLEHLMFKGTPTVPAGEFSKIVARVGGNDNAFTSYDYTAYHQTIAADQLELVMRMEADRMANLIVAEQELLPERDVVLEERRTRTDNQPAALLDEVTREALYGRQGYGIPVIGFAQEIRGLGVADAQSFYDHHYAPNNAVLLIAGDTTGDAVRALADKYYAAVPRKQVPPRTRSTAIGTGLPRTVERRDRRVAQAEWSRDYVAPSYRLGETRHAYALQVLAQALGGGQTGRLYRTLVLDSKVAIDASAGYSAQTLGLTSFGIGVTPAPQKTVADAAAAAQQQVVRLLRDGLTDDEIDRAKRRLLAAAIYARDSLTSGPQMYGSTLTTGGTMADVDEWPTRIVAVTSGQIVEAARAVLDESRSVTSLLLPENG